MCGIAGAIGNGDWAAAVSAMVSALHHRGPDDKGIEEIPTSAGSIVLGNTRLAIIDLTSAGHMPMQDRETGNWITYNGEVYNFADLRTELEAAGERFESGTDTEVLLHAYRRWGPTCVSRIHGMFAMAIWDATRQELFLARDRLGKKPLYFSSRPGLFVFASEVRSLLATSVIAPRISAIAQETYLFNGFVVSPATMIDEVESLLPGSWMRVGADGSVLGTVRYWRLPTERRGEPVRLEERRDAIRGSLHQAVRERLVSDVPLGAFLSGGLDSSAIVAMMSGGASEVRTFSVVFEEAAYNEATFARAVAQRFATQHSELLLRRTDFEAWLPDALDGMDQPTFDGINSYCVSRAAREGGLTVALSGLGGDEIFGGYFTFGLVPRIARLSAFIGVLPGAFRSDLVHRLERHPFRMAGPSKLFELVLGGHLKGRITRLIAAYQTAQMVFPEWSRRRILGDRRDTARDLTWFGLPLAFVELLLAENDEGDSDLSVVSRLSERLFLAERCLRDTDSMAMAVSLEVRAPFTDHRLLDEVWTVPSSIRCAGTPNKPFEWELLHPILGAAYEYRPKQGFTFPIPEWLRAGVFRDMVGDTLSDTSATSRAGVSPTYASRLFDAYSQRRRGVDWSSVWALFVLVRWCQRNGVSV
jgi:asparagine synthase (glutamine-hydrolysing)